MTIPTALKVALDAGVSVRRDGNRLVVSATSRPDEHLLEGLRCRKLEIVNYLRDLIAWTEEDWQALFDERAGILEFEGGLPRVEAEDRAKAEVVAHRRLVPEPSNG